MVGTLKTKIHFTCSYVNRNMLKTCTCVYDIYITVCTQLEGRNSHNKQYVEKKLREAGKFIN